MLPYLALLGCLFSVDVADKPFAIQVVDAQTGRGVPLVELETTSGQVFLTDSAGIVAFAEPGLLGSEVWFNIRSHGYEFPADGFGIRGVKLLTTPGATATVRLPRKNIAERVCRLSGGGIYRDSVLAGKIPADQGLLLRAQILGYDSVQAAVYRNQIHWFWGDTNRASYPLGNFHMTGARSALPTHEQQSVNPFQLHPGESSPLQGVNYDYFIGDDGFARGVCQMAGNGPTWADGVTLLKDDTGRERLYCAFSKIRPPLSVYRRGIAVWNDEKETFEEVAEFPVDAPLYPFGHPRRMTENGVDYVVFGDPFPITRVRATVADFLDLSRYEGFTPLLPGSSAGARLIETDGAGQVVYAWKSQTPGISPAIEKELASRLPAMKQAQHWQLEDARTGDAIEAHRGTVTWNARRGKWVLITTQLGGTSMLGEVWYAEADAATGPWRSAVKIVTHDRYSFYNPRQLEFFDAPDGRCIYFEGTYTHTFSGNPHKTPYYDYNQVLYRLDLDDPRLRP